MKILRTGSLGSNFTGSYKKKSVIYYFGRRWTGRWGGPCGTPYVILSKVVHLLLL